MLDDDRRPSSSKWRNGRKGSVSGIHLGFQATNQETELKGEDTRLDNEEDAPGADARVETRRHAGAYATWLHLASFSLSLSLSVHDSLRFPCNPASRGTLRHIFMRRINSRHCLALGKPASFSSTKLRSALISSRSLPDLQIDVIC